GWRRTGRRASSTSSPPRPGRWRRWSTRWKPSPRPFFGTSAEANLLGPKGVHVFRIGVPSRRPRRGRTALDLHGAVAHGLGSPGGSWLGSRGATSTPRTGHRGPSPPTSGAPTARRPAAVSAERPALPRGGAPPLDTGDLARLPCDTPDRAPLAPRARATEVVPRCRPFAGPTGSSLHDGVLSCELHQDAPRLASEAMVSAFAFPSLTP